MDYIREVHGKQATVRVARDLGDRLETFVKPLLVELDRHIDKPLARSSTASHFLGEIGMTHVYLGDQITAGLRDLNDGVLLSERLGDRLGLFPGGSFQNFDRGTVDQFLGFFQAQVGTEGAHGLDDLDLLGTDVLQDHVTLGLFFPFFRYLLTLLGPSPLHLYK